MLSAATAKTDVERSLAIINGSSLRYSFYGGWRNVKILSSGECRKIRDCCIFRVNDLEVFL